MIINLEKHLLEPLVVLSRIGKADTGMAEDVYLATEVAGTWREVKTNSAGDDGTGYRGDAVKVHVPRLRYIRYSEFVKDLNQDGFTLSHGDYVVKGELTDDGLVAATGFVMPYEVTDGFAIIQDGVTLPLRRGHNTAKQVVQAMRKSGGICVTSWQDLRRNGSIKAAGIPGMFADCVYMEGR